MRKVGILGGGQLGRMMALAGYPLDIACRLWDPAPDACAGQVTELLHAPYSDPNALVHFIEGLECATFEFENIDLAVAQAVAEHIPVHPTPDALRLFQDRLLEKQTLRRYGIPTPNFAEVDPAHPERALAEVGLPAVLKTRRFGYDGKGQVVVHTEEQFHEAVAHFAGQPLIVEAFVPFEREVSTIGVRGHSGEFVCYPLIENLHYEGVLRLSIVGSGEWGMGSGTSEGSGQWAVGSGESSLTHPCPPSPEASGEGGSQTPLSHSVGEGQGVRAKEVHGRDARAMNEEGQGVRAISLLIAGILLVLWFGVGAYLKSVWSMPPAETVRVAIIQPNVDLARAYHPEEWETVRAHLADLIQQAGTQQPDLIVFPEVMEPYPMPDSPRAFAWWRAQVQQVGIPILTGGYRIADRENDQWTNAQHLFLPDGTWHYHDKVQLVPLGERVPYREFLGFLRIFGVVERDMLPGKELRPLEVGAMRIGTVICMESSYPWVARGMVREGANLLVVGSNESWFGRTPALQQHLAFSVMRAIETRRWVVRSAPEGVSAFIAPNGKVQELTPFKPIVETAPVGLLESQTLAVRWGDWAIWVSAFFVAGCWMLKRGR